MSGEYKGGPPQPPTENDIEQNRAPEQGPIKGRIINWKKEKGFGFIQLTDGRRVFCHVNNMCEHIKPSRGQEPTATRVYVSKVIQRERGPAAEHVECDDCATPEEWGLRPTGNPVFGVYELESYCVNKPNGNKLRPGYEVAFKANEPFRQAQEKMKLWKLGLRPEGISAGISVKKFFSIFGEPISVTVSGNELVLRYPNDEKKIWLYQAMDTGHWETTSSGEWKQNESYISAEFVFDDIPGAKVWRIVASLAIHPHLEKEFNLLQPKKQEEILTVVREKILSPQSIAAERFDHFLKEKNTQNIIKGLRDDIIALQAPGGAIVHSANERYTVSYGESPDERMPAGSYQTTKTFYYLTTGVKKLGKGISSWRNSPEGVKTFAIQKPMKDETADSTRDKLLAEKKLELNLQFEYAKKITPPEPDSRLYALTPEQWTQQYNKQWDQIQTQVEATWQIDADQTLEKMREEYNSYELTRVTLEETLEAQNKLMDEARNLHINMDNLDSPQRVFIGLDPIEKLKKNIDELKIFNAQLLNLITTELSKRGERRITDSAQLKTETEIVASPATWYLNGVDPSMFEKYGRKPGEGFGPKVAGRNLYLPGARAVVGIAFAGMYRRYDQQINSIGISPLEGTLPTVASGKRTSEFLGIVDDPDWKVFWVSNKDDAPENYSLANSKGIGNYFAFKDVERFSSKGWDGTEGTGPTKEEIMAIFNLPPPIKGKSVFYSTERPSPPAGNNPFAAKLSAALKDK